MVTARTAGWNRHSAGCPLTRSARQGTNGRRSTARSRLISSDTWTPYIPRRLFDEKRPTTNCRDHQPGGHGRSLANPPGGFIRRTRSGLARPDRMRVFARRGLPNRNEGGEPLRPPHRARCDRCREPIPGGKACPGFDSPMSEFHNRTRRSKSLPLALLRRGHLLGLVLYYLLRRSSLAREGLENSGSYRFADHIYRGVPSGSGRFGPWLDSRLLALPAARSFRNRFFAARDELAAFLCRRAGSALDVLSV